MTYAASLLLITGIYLAALSLSWRLGITLIFGTPALRGFYLRIERRVYGVAGGMLVTLGLQRLLSR